MTANTTPIDLLKLYASKGKTVSELLLEDITVWVESAGAMGLGRIRHEQEPSVDKAIGAARDFLEESEAVARKIASELAGTATGVRVVASNTAETEETVATLLDEVATEASGDARGVSEHA